MKRNQREPMDIDVEKAKELRAALFSFVTWRTTPQGFDYWDQVEKNVEALVASANNTGSVDPVTK